MNAESKVTAGHLERAAYLYVRQSSLHQVIENTESTERQYALRRRAVALGWPEDKIVVIDRDQGQSGEDGVVAPADACLLVAFVQHALHRLSGDVLGQSRQRPVRNGRQRWS